jgi:hypothetical protein
MELSTPLPTPLFRHHFMRGFHRLIPSHGDEGIERTLQASNALEASRS